MTTEDRPVVFAVAGGGEITESTVADLLDFFFELDTDEPRDVGAIYLPADAHITSDATLHALKWIKEVQLPYTAVTSPTPGFKGSEVARSTRTHVKAESGDTSTTLIECLTKHHDDSDVYLLLAWGEELDKPADETTLALFEDADRYGITVLNLNAGLQTISYRDEDDATGDDFDANPEDLADDEELDEAQAAIPAPKDDHDHDHDCDCGNGVPALPVVLAYLYTMLLAQDRRNAARAMQRVRLSPLTKAVRHYLVKEINNMPDEERTILDEPGESDPLDYVPGDEEVKLRGKPRDTSTDEIPVLINEEKKTIRLAGRGRPRSGEVKRTMTRDEFERLAAEWADS